MNGEVALLYRKAEVYLPEVIKLVCSLSLLLVRSNSQYLSF